MTYSVNGLGTIYYGRRHLGDGTWVTTKWFAIFYMPIVPLGSFRIMSAEPVKQRLWFQDKWLLSQHRVPLDWRMVARVYAWAAGVIAAFYGLGELVDRL